jgi:hypothetical protein
MDKIAKAAGQINKINNRKSNSANKKN